MNITALYKAFKEKKWTDLELILDDGSNKLTLNVHKILLIEHSAYFEKLLTFNHDPSTLTLNIPNAHVASDVILSFYGVDLNTSNLSKWSHALALAKCRDYFNLEALKYDIPENIKIDDYDVILELCSIVGFDEVNLRVLSENLPLDYPLEKLSSEFIKEIVKNKTSFIIISHTPSDVNLWDIRTGKIIDTFHNNTDIEYAVISSDNKYLLIKGENDCHIWDLMSHILKYSFYDCSTAVFSPDGSFLAIGYPLRIDLVDLLTNNIIASLNLEQICRILAFVPFSENNLLVIVDDNSVKIWNKNNITILTERTCNHISFSNNGKYMDTISIIHSWGLGETIITKVWDISTDIPIELFKGSLINSTSFQHHSKTTSFEYKSTTDYVVIVRKKLEIHDVNDNSIVYLFDVSGEITFAPFNDYIMIHNGYNAEHYYTEVRNIVTGKKYFRSRCLHIFSPQSTFLAEDNFNFIQIWDVTKNCIKYTIEMTECNYMTFTPDERYFIVNDDYTVCVYSMHNGELLHEIYVPVKNICFNIHYDDLCQRLLEEKID